MVWSSIMTRLVGVNVWASHNDGAKAALQKAARMRKCFIEVR